MKAITIYQPWASLIVEGNKQFQTRRWATSYRGKLAIHAAKTDKYLKLLDFSLDLRPIFPLMAIVGVVTLIDCHQITEKFKSAQSKSELDLADWSLGLYAWETKPEYSLDNPIVIKGQQGLWNWNLKK